MEARTDDTTLPIRAAPVEADLGALIRPPTDDLEPFSRGLERGRLMLQRCSECSRPRWPLGPVCPHCGSTAFAWDVVGGRGRVHSWIRYRRGFLEAFEPLLPYVVVCGELADGGVRLFGRLLGDGPEPRSGMPVGAVVERWRDGSHVLAFEREEEK
jgi:uncharacterized OB-fold protein